MSKFSRLLAALASWCLLAQAAAGADTGVLEVEMVFPRNTTYAPTSRMPFVFALKNPELARILNPSISFDVWAGNSTTNLGDRWYLRWTNFSSSDPYFYYHGFTHYNTEDHWTVNWRFEWDSCVRTKSNRDLTTPMISNATGGRVEFTTSKSASAGEMDLVAALQDGSSCSPSGARSPGGVAINITGTTQADTYWSDFGGDYCALVANQSAALTPSPCGVEVDAAAATSIAAWVTQHVCLATDAPLGCLSLKSSESSGAQRVAVGSVACLAAGLGGLTYLLRFL